MSERFSTFVIKALADTITGGSANDPTPPIGVYRSGPEIERFFLDCGVDLRIGSGSRYPATLDRLREVSRDYDGDEQLKRLLLKVCDPREYLAEPDKAAAVREHVNRALEPDGLSIAIVGGKAHLVERQSAGMIVEPFISKVATLDFDTVQSEIARALANAIDDSEDAVTAASSLIEAVCRSILVELRLPLPAKRDRPACRIISHYS